MDQFRKITLVVLLVSSVFISCRKNEAPSSEEKPLSLLRKIEWDNDITSEYHYNADSTLKEISFYSGSAGGMYSFTYAGKQVVEVYSGESLYTHKYYYTNGLLTTLVNASRHSTIIDSYKLEYEYDQQKRLSRLLYYDIHEAGTTLMATSTYEYNSDNLPSKIITQTGNVKLLTYIDSYSKTLHFNPWVYVSIGLSEQYMLYNYPILRNATKLPRVVRVNRITGSGPELPEKSTVTSYFSTSNRLDSVKVITEFPNFPQYNSSFSYKLFY